MEGTQRGQYTNYLTEPVSVKEEEENWIEGVYRKKDPEQRTTGRVRHQDSRATATQKLSSRPEASGKGEWKEKSSTGEMLLSH